MLILLTIFLFLFVPLVISIIYLVRPKFSIQGFLVILAALAGWPLIFLARSNLPYTIPLPPWKPETIFPVSPAMLIDDISWYFSLALSALALALIITSIAQLGQTARSGQTQDRKQIEDEEAQAHSASMKSLIDYPANESGENNPTWQSWAGILVLTSFGLLAATSGNMLTLLLAWAAVDVIELVILLGQVLQSKARERIILAFTARMAGIGTVFLAGIIPWSRGISLTFDAITQETSIYLLVAAGLRLGVLPLHIPFIQILPLRRGLGTSLRLIPAASSYILLARVANTGVLSPATPFLLGLTALAGSYAAVKWLTAKDELAGRPFWLLGTAALAVASAIVKQPLACLAWSLASVLSGGVIFSMSIHHKNYVPITVLALIGFSALPFSPTWRGTSLFQSIHELLIPSMAVVFIIWFGLIHSFLLAGFIRHALLGILPSASPASAHVERWAGFLFLIGQVFLIITQLLIGFWILPDLQGITIFGWIMGITAVLISSAVWYSYWRYQPEVNRAGESIKPSPVSNILSMDWLYQLLWQIFRLVSKLFAFLSAILEGDGGILWALVLFALIFVFLQR